MLTFISDLLGAIPIIGGLLQKFFPSLAGSKAVESVVNFATLTETDIANYDSGQAVVVATIYPSEVPGATANGVLVAMMDGGAAYNGLFGSN